VFPVMWLIVLPANFLIDSIVLLAFLKLLHIEPFWASYRRSILYVLGFGFASDLIGAMLLFATQSGDSRWWYEFVQSPVAFNPFDNALSLLIVLLAVAIAGAAIWFFNRRISFRHLQATDRQKRALALALALLTAPYVLLVPSQLLHSPGSEVHFFTNHIVPNAQYSLTAMPGESLTSLSVLLPSQDISDLRQAVNTARRDYGASRPDAPADYSLLFYARQDAEQRTLVLLWLPDDGSAIFVHEDRVYSVTGEKAAALREIMDRAAEGGNESEFTLWIDGERDNTIYEKLWEDSDYVYYLNGLKPAQVMLKFSDGTMVDVQKALEVGLVGIDELADQGLDLTSEYK